MQTSQIVDLIPLTGQLRSKKAQTKKHTFLRISGPPWGGGGSPETRGRIYGALATLRQWKSFVGQPVNYKPGASKQ
jgi:hypothetical protein